MKYFYSFLISILFPLFSSAQLPSGKLYTLLQTGGGSSANSFGYYHLPDSDFVQIDTVAFSDIEIQGDRLYIASGYYYMDSLPVYIYDLQTDQKLDSIPHLEAKKIDFWKGNIVSINNSHPYFSVHQAQAPYTFVFSFDSTYFSYQPVDFKIVGNKAFVLYQSSMVIIDLVAQDTIEMVAINPPSVWRKWFWKISNTGWFKNLY